MGEVHFYDAQGRLVLTEYASSATRFVHAAGQKVEGLDASGQPVWQAVWGAGLDELVWWRDVQAGRGYIPLSEGRHSVVGLWDQEAASLSHARSFDAMGRVTLYNPDESVGCQESDAPADQTCEWQGPQARFGFGWHSAWRSPVTGLVQMRNRWYSPPLGQFMSHDPLEYIDSHNLFAFAGQDPVGGWDPFGLSEKSFVEEIRQDIKGRRKFAEDQFDACLKNPGINCVKGPLMGMSFVVSSYTSVEDEYERRRNAGEGRVVSLLEGMRKVSDPGAGAREGIKAHGACKAGDKVACAQRNNAIGQEGLGAALGAKARVNTRVKKTSRSSHSGKPEGSGNQTGSSGNKKGDNEGGLTGGNLETMNRRGADGRLADGHTENCANCAVALDAQLSGGSASPLPGTPTPVSALEYYYNGRFKYFFYFRRSERCSQTCRSRIQRDCIWS